jgi:outer membrane protein OmpA-like peptidoglycan-associated protein
MKKDALLRLLPPLLSLLVALPCWPQDDSGGEMSLEEAFQAVLSGMRAERYEETYQLASSILDQYEQDDDFRVRISFFAGAALSKVAEEFSQDLQAISHLTYTIENFEKLEFAQAASLEGFKQDVYFHAASILQKYILHTQFDTDSSTIKEESFDDLAAAAMLLRVSRGSIVILVGHTDSVGDADYNMDLSSRRADSVKQYLVDRGADPRRTITRGEGESQPVASNDTPEGRRENRRVNVLMAQTDVIGDMQEARARLERGAVLEADGDLDGAIAEYEKGVAAKADFDEVILALVNACVNRGLARTAEGSFDAALADYHRVMEFGIALDILHYNIGCNYSLQNDPEEAVVHLRKALENGFDQIDHIGQDTDWDNVRDTGAFKMLMEEYPAPPGGDDLPTRSDL